MPCYNPSNVTFKQAESNIDFLKTSELGASIAKAIENDNALDSKQQYESFSQLAKILLQDVKLSRESEQFALRTAYNYMHQQWNEMYPLADNKNESLKLIQEVQQKLFKETKDKGLQTIYAVDYAQTLMVSEQIDKAIEYLNKVSELFDGDNLLFIEGIICQAEIYNELANNPDMQEEIPELLAKCVKSDINLKSGRIANKTMPDDNVIFENIVLDIVPNPVGENSTIVVSGLKEAGKIEIYNTTGKLVFTEDIDSEAYHLYVSNTTYKPGIYLLTINVNGQTAKSSKMVVVE